MSARIWVCGWIAFSLAAAGCGSGDDPQGAGAGAGGASAVSSRAGSVTAGASAAAPAAGASDAAAATTPAAVTPPQPTEPPATAEQISRWTPPPFEPLALLSICQWKQPSFTSRLAAVADGMHFIVAGSRVLLWAVDGKEPEHVFLDVAVDEGADDDGRELEALAVAPDGKWFAVGDSEGTLRIWNLADRKELVTKQLYQTGIQDAAVSPDGGEIATISYDGHVSTWDANTLAPRKKFKVNTSGVERIEYAAPNIVAAAGESTALWNTKTGDKVHDLPADRYNFALARTPDGAKFLFGAEDSIRVWDVAAGKLDALVIRGVTGDALLAVSPDGKTLATTDGRGVELWNLADGRRVQTIPGFGATIVGVKWLPQTNLLAVASESGVTRIWGTAAQGKAAGLAPLDAPIAAYDPAAKAPATPEQLAQIIDLHALPALPTSQTSVQFATMITSEAPVGAAEARAFYRHFLTQAGWQESPADPNLPTSLEFRKEGATITGSFYDGGDGKTNISLNLDGAYDVRWAPKADAESIEIVYENAGTCSYRAQASILALETSLLRKLHAAGWAAYSRLHTSSSEEPDSRDFEFLRNGATLRVSIGKFPDDTAETFTVQYTLFPNTAWAPVPPDAGYVEFDGSTEPALVAITALGLPEVREFYDRELAASGWTARPIGRSIKEKHAWLPYLRGQCDFGVSAVKLPDGRTLVRIGDTRGSLWDASQADEDEEGEAAPPADGLQAADFPALNATKTAKYDELGETIEVRIEGSTLADAAAAYTKALGELGWKAEAGGIRDEEYTFFDFTKGEQDFSLRARKQDGAAIVSFEGDGLLWTKPLPVAKQVVSYETWLRLNKLPASLEFLEKYEGEMKGIAGE